MKSLLTAGVDAVSQPHAAEALRQFSAEAPWPSFVKFLDGDYISACEFFVDRFEVDVEDLNDSSFETIFQAPKDSEARLEATLQRTKRPQLFSYEIIDPATKQRKLIRLYAMPGVLGDRDIRTTYITAIFKPLRDAMI